MHSISFLLCVMVGIEILIEVNEEGECDVGHSIKFLDPINKSGIINKADIHTLCQLHALDVL